MLQVPMHISVSGFRDSRSNMQDDLLAQQLQLVIAVSYGSSVELSIEVRVHSSVYDFNFDHCLMGFRRGVRDSAHGYSRLVKWKVSKDRILLQL
jgi:hypothetical protein